MQLDCCLDVVTCKLFCSVFSILGRMEILAGCRDPRIARYRHSKFEDGTAQMLRDLHRTLRKSWLRAGSGECRVDFQTYLAERPILFAIAPRLTARSFAPLIPDSAGAAERELFLTKIDDALRAVISAKCTGSPMEREGAGVRPFEQALALIRRRYTDCDFSVHAASEMLHVSERHLRRLFRQSMPAITLLSRSRARDCRSMPKCRWSSVTL